ncbi:LysR substrate-binding domain-containing protein [Sodalis sp. dw_96]|uniref:LysR substrate-binding domain-containing protein n=1 Tax=Sodalis sp. dw_96 TaxID=2719794 RepID=UPI001BD2953E|nr:LysR substrate-binding domain-containing protein [Sodalis sp. dw_96]
MGALPSLDVLKTFVVVAEQLNFTHAAQRLHITQGAVSRQIAGLERHLGAALFIRLARGLALTERGGALLAPLQQAIGQIDTALAAFNAKPDTLRVKCPTCVMRWLLPRVIQLQAQHPEIDIALTTAITHGVDFSHEHFDAAVLYGRPADKQLRAIHLFDEVLTPVCVPEIWRDNASITDGLANKTLLHPTRDRRDWLAWLKAAGCEAMPATKAQHFDTLDLAMTAAIQGYGVAIGDLCLIEYELQAGRLIAPFSQCLRSGAAYYLVFPEHSVLSPALVLLMEWLQQEARHSRRRQRDNMPDAMALDSIAGNTW